MEYFFLDLGFSWTMSKVLPYIICLIAGILILILLRKRIKHGLIRKLMNVVIIIPFSIYFAINPIYEGDFSNNFEHLPVVADSLNLQKNTLTIFAIPNCPYCAEAIDGLNKLSERTKTNSFNFIVLSSDPESTTNYRKMASKSIAITNDPDFSKFESITKGSFPTFVYRDDNGVYVWGNDVFGVRAMDWVESALKK